MKILMVAPQPFFSPRGTPLSVYYRLKVLAELGCEIDLLTYGQGEDPEIDGVTTIRIPAFRSLGPVPVGPSWFKAFLDFFIVARLIELLIRRRYDAVWAHEEAALICRQLKSIFRFKLIYDMHSSLPQQLSNFEFSNSRLLIALFRRLEKGCLETSESVVTISPALAEQATAAMPNPENHVLIENTLFEPIALKSRSSSANNDHLWKHRIPPDTPVLGYAGTLEPYQGIDLLLQALQLIDESKFPHYLLLIGGGSDQVSRYRRIAEEGGIGDRCLFTGPMSVDSTRNLLRRADILVSPRLRGTNTPLKIYEILASGKPLVATRVDAHLQVLDDSFAFLSEPDPGSLAKTICTVFEDPKRRSEVVRAAQRRYRERYTPDIYRQKMRQVLEIVS